MNRNNRINSVDEKGRVALPRALRKSILHNNHKVVLTRGFDPCVLIYTIDEWRLFVERLKGWSLTRKNRRRIVRAVMGMSEEVEIDGNGRVLIPGHLAGYANIKEKCLFVTMPLWIEIWNPESYEEYQSDVMESIQKEEIDLEDFPL